MTPPGPPGNVVAPAGPELEVALRASITIMAMIIVVIVIILLLIMLVLLLIIILLLLLLLLVIIIMIIEAAVRAPPPVAGAGRVPDRGRQNMICEGGRTCKPEPNKTHKHINFT